MLLVSIQNEVKITISSLQFLKVTLLHAKRKYEKHSDHLCCHGCTVTRQNHLQSKFDKKTVGEYFLFSLHGINVLLRFRFLQAWWM